MVTDTLKFVLRCAGFGKFAWFRKWHGGLWQKHYDLGSALRRGLLCDASAQVVSGNRVVVAVEYWPEGT